MKKVEIQLTEKEFEFIEKKSKEADIGVSEFISHLIREIIKRQPTKKLKR